MSGFGTLDWIVIAGYFVVIMGIAFWVVAQRQKSSTDYFLAGRHMPWFVVGASIFASNIGSEHIVGLAGQGSTSGMAMAHWELHAWVVVMLAWVFIPFYYRSRVFTMPEFLERRFNPTARWILSIVSLVAYVFTKVSVTVYAGGVVFNVLLPEIHIPVTESFTLDAFWLGALLTVTLTGLYTVLGGLRAVVYTDTIQTVILLIGSAFITFFGLSKLGGWTELQSICRENATNFALWRPNTDPDFPWLGVLIASPIIGIWYWCTDQYIVQRALAAKDLRNARRGALWGSFLKVWPVMIFVVPGLIGYALHQKGLITIPTKMVDGQPALDGDHVFAVMVTELLPMGLRGLVVGGLLAALMSSLSSLFNSCASLFTVDIYEKIRPKASEQHLVTVGRIATIVVVFMGIIWIPVMQRVSQGGLYKYLQSVQGYLAPPIAAVFLLGLFFKRINGKGAVAGLAIGFVAGMAKLTIQALTGGSDPTIASPSWLVAIGQYNFLFATGWLLGLSIIVVVAVSLVTAPPNAEQIIGLTYATATAEQKKENRQSWNAIDIVITVVVLGLVLGLYLYFSFWLR
ncbi:MAG TPA: Na+/glucose cotransporter [Phycisphaerales bacterium]|nr:Na+/glucose cotransporter [Phycisphaerales bacterium]